MIEAVLFDLDNTLMDFMKMKRIASENAISAMIDAGLTIKKGKATKILFTMYETHGIENQKIFQLFLKETMGKIDYKILSAGISAYRKAKASSVEPYPTVIGTLLELIRRGYKIGIVTDAPRLQGWTRLADMKLHHYFDFVVALEDTGKLKPNKSPFEAAIKKLKIDPENILFVGDNPKKDIKGAKKVGMKTALATYGWLKKKFPQKKGEKPDFKLKKFKDLLQILG